MPAFNIFKKKKAFFDLDGTVYLGNTLIAGAPDLFKKLAENDVACFFLSNNTSKIKPEYVRRLNSMGISCEEKNIILPTDALLQQLKLENVTDIFLVGTAQLEAFIAANGISTKSENPKYVVVAFDTELTYDKLYKASMHIQKGVPYLATNIDVFCPTDQGNIPDTGSICQLLQETTGVKPKKVFGKPLPSMIKSYIADVKMEDIVIVGDRIYTDLQLARSLNCDFVLTLTGESTPADVPDLNYDKCMVVNTISDLMYNHQIA